MTEIPTGDDIKKLPYEYYKREGRRFFFRNEHLQFDIELFDKELFDFIDNYDVGDWIKFYK